VPDAKPSDERDAGRRQPDDHAGTAGPPPSGGSGRTGPVREFRRSGADRVGDAVFSILARAGIGPAHLLTTRGRTTGRARTAPVILVVQDQQRWLVAPYGAVSWVLNARAAVLPGGQGLAGGGLHRRSPPPSGLRTGPRR